MNIELKEIDKDTLKVGDWVGIAREVSYGWGSSFRHELIFRHKLQESLQSEPSSLRISLENMTKEKYFMSVIVKLRKKLFLLRHFVLLKTEYLS